MRAGPPRGILEGSLDARRASARVRVEVEGPTSAYMRGGHRRAALSYRTAAQLRREDIRTRGPEVHARAIITVPRLAVAVLCARCGHDTVVLFPRAVWGLGSARPSRRVVACRLVVVTCSDRVQDATSGGVPNPSVQRPAGRPTDAHVGYGRLVGVFRHPFYAVYDGRLRSRTVAAQHLHADERGAGRNAYHVPRVVLGRQRAGHVRAVAIAVLVLAVSCKVDVVDDVEVRVGLVDAGVEDVG